MKISYNAPVILTFTLICAGILVSSQMMAGALINNFFVCYPHMSLTNPLTYFRLFSHVIGHKDWAHLIGNFSFILLIGPILEEKYGSKKIFLMMLIAAGITGILNSFFFSTGLLGASGIVFMFIILGSFTNFKSGDIPLTFILIILLYLAKEVIDAFHNDSISQFAHIMGGICGSIFGFKSVKR
jgi:membrane associated rhomboid family serine protease